MPPRSEVRRLDARRIIGYKTEVKATHYRKDGTIVTVTHQIPIWEPYDSTKRKLEPAFDEAKEDEEFEKALEEVLQKAEDSARAKKFARLFH